MPQFRPDSRLREWLIEIRRHLHQYPELANREVKTAAYICHQLTGLGIHYRAGVGGTGIVATLNDSVDDDRPGVALRADMDALPLQEETGLPFASRHPGVMHACGHDGHVAILLGAAALLKNQEKELPGRVVLLFQPAEEGGGGAQTMISEGCLKGVGLIFGGHLDRHFRVGQIAVQAGVICASTDSFRIEVRGRGGHAAKPHETVDAIIAAAQLVNIVQTLISREIDPVRPAVISIGQIQGGTAANVIADRVTLTGTIRTTDPRTRTQLFEGMERMVRQTGQLYRAAIDISFSEGYPPIVNDPAAADLARQAALATVGAGQVPGLDYPSLGGEDFSFFLDRVPGCFVRFGGQRQDLPEAAAHSSRFDFDEGALPVGAEYMARVARAALLNLGNGHGTT
jgi:hippurate hydrolase